jgi:hypothetical protein
VKDLASWLDKTLIENQKKNITYIAIEKITAADFAVASLLFTFVLNENFAGGPNFL